MDSTVIIGLAREVVARPANEGEVVVAARNTESPFEYEYKSLNLFPK